MLTEFDQVRAALDDLPLFPLPDGVLLPYELLPLHIFEPRYREMIAHVLETGSPLAVGRLAPGWEADYEGRPPVAPTFGAGVITRSEKLPDGRYNILLKGVLRLRLQRELPPTRPWRRVQAVELADTSGDPTLLTERTESLRRMVFALCSARPGPAANALSLMVARLTTPGALADVVAAALFTELPLRLQLLETADPSERLELTQAHVAELLVGTTDAEGGGRRLLN